jgi:hypothetical protein
LQALLEAMLLGQVSTRQDGARARASEPYGTNRFDDEAVVVCTPRSARPIPGAMETWSDGRDTNLFSVPMMKKITRPRILIWNSKRGDPEHLLQGQGYPRKPVQVAFHAAHFEQTVRSQPSGLHWLLHRPLHRLRSARFLSGGSGGCNGGRSSRISRCRLEPIRFAGCEGRIFIRR